jgi:hypothetical protein
MHVVADQPQIVRQSMNLFMSSLAEAVLIVLAVSFISLGLRTGAVVALSIPLVLAITFLLMYAFGIDLQRISLGALVICARPAGRRCDHRRRDDGREDGTGLGSLPRRDLRLYLDRLSDAHRHADHRRRLHAGGLARSGAGEYTFSIFAVVSIALLVSWVVAVLFTPYLGYLVLDAAKLQREGASSMAKRSLRHAVLSPRAGDVEWSLRIAGWSSRDAARFRGSAGGTGHSACRSSSSRPRAGPSCWSTCGCRTARR